MRVLAACIAVALTLIGTDAGAADMRVTGAVHELTVGPGMTLRSVGSRQGVDPRVIAADSGLALDAPLRPGTTLRIDNRHIVPDGLDPGTLVINIPQRMLFYRRGEETVGMPAAVGRATWPTPLGAFSIVNKEADPTWYVPVSMRQAARAAGRVLPLTVPPGPHNPLGRYWLGLSVPGIGIHGTNAPSSIYQVSTHGCIRLHAADIAWLFDILSPGTTGRIVYEPVLLVTDERGDVFLEVHPDVYQRQDGEAMAIVRERAAALGLVSSIDWARAQRVIAVRAGVARRITR